MANVSVLVERGNSNYKLFKIRNKPSDVYIELLSKSGGEHISLHRKGDEIIKTHWAANKIPRTWDNLRVEAARKLGWEDPDRHGKYYFHNTVDFFLNPCPIVSMKFNQNNLKIGFARSESRIIAVSADEFWIDIYFANNNSMPEGHSQKIETNFGSLFIVAREA